MISRTSFLKKVIGMLGDVADTSLLTLWTSSSDQAKLQGLQEACM